MIESALEPQEAAVVRDLAQEALEAQILDRGDLVKIGEKVVDLESFADAPRRTALVRTVDTIDSLVQYAFDASPGSETVAFWVDETNRRLEAVLDHSGTTPRWEDHRAGLQILHSDDWTDWNRFSQAGLTGQETFAEFLEDHLDTIRGPLTGAEMLELATTIQATTSAEFRSAVRLQDGTRQFTYSEDVETRAGQAGTLLIPELVDLGIEVYDRTGIAHPLQARFRYRLVGGKLTLGLRLIRPQDAARAAWDDLVVSLDDAIGERWNVTPPVYRGRRA